ncbi:MAG: type II secretion system protein [Elusimicrobia bacterium]|nr:type II secretion system protein [Elusimicrobiota bacterium]
MIIMGVLAMIAVPRYTKTIEVSRAEEAVALLNLVHSANKMYVLNTCPSTGQNCYCTGGDDALRQVASCDDPVTGGSQNLVALGYIPDYNNPQRPYCYLGANNGSAGTYSACIRRRTGPGSPYENWGYAMSSNGQVCYFDDDTAAAPNPFIPTGAVSCVGNDVCACP